MRELSASLSKGRVCARSGTSIEIIHPLFAPMHYRLLTPFPLCCRGAVCWRLALFQEIVPIMDLAVNEEFTRMYSEEELMGSRRIQARVETMKDKHGRGRARVFRLRRSE